MAEIGEEHDGPPSAELVPNAQERSLFKTDEPAEVIDQAVKVANKLKSVLQTQGMVSKISDREHVAVEGWQSVGQMLGVTPVKEWVRAVPWPEQFSSETAQKQHELGKSYGFVASYQAKTLDGRVIGSAEAMCTRGEKTWMSRDDYALASMAQTRATSKALKSVLGFVVTLAGYSSTPAEEMPGEQEAQTGKPFGPEAEIKSRDRALSALKFLLQDDADDHVTAPKLSAKVWGAIEEAAGYFPAIVATALLHAGAALKESRAPEPTPEEVAAAAHIEETITDAEVVS